MHIVRSGMAVAATLVATQGWAQTGYSIKKLGPLSGDGGSSASGVNNSAQVSGWSIGSGERPYRWSAGVMEALPIAGSGTSNFALGINEAGQVVGYASFPGAASNAALWTRDDNGTWGVEDLGILQGFAFSRAADLTDDGRLAVGDVDDAIDGFLAVAFEYDDDASPPWQVVSMGVLSGYDVSYAHGVNNDGVAVGGSFDYSTASVRGTMWTRGGSGWTSEALPLLSGGSANLAWAINDDGAVTGWADASDSLAHAVIWHHDAIIDLGAYPNENTIGLAINNNETVVGETWSASGRERAFIADNNQILDLNDLIPPDTGWDLKTATGINDDGQIVGEGHLGGFRHSFLLTPVSGSLTGPTPGQVGLNSFTVTMNTNTYVYLFYSYATGETAIPNCPAVPLNLDNATYIATFPSGGGTVTVDLPDEFSGQTVYFQAYASGCKVSNVVKHTFP